MINIIKGDIFKSKDFILVNPVNCEGVMGKGVAFQFKNKYPLMFKDYKEACKKGELKIGRLHFYFHSGTSAVNGINPKLIINFPTKITWKEKTKIEYISQGLDSLVKFLKTCEISAISIPALGCGCGGLEWKQVRPLMVKKLKPVQNTQITIYKPIK